MRLPRSLSGAELAFLLGRFDYNVTRQTGSHLRLTRESPGGRHHVTIPLHRELRAGTLSSILADVAAHLSMDRDALMQALFQ